MIPHPQKVLVMIPAHNEGIKLKNTAERVHETVTNGKLALTTDVMIVDDASEGDETKQIADEFKFLYQQNSVREGVGFCIRKAYEYGLHNGYDILITMAGNNKDNPAEFCRLIEPILSGQADFVQGSRYLPGGKFGNMPAYRLITTKYIHPLLFSMVSGKRITDSTNGFRAIRSSLLNDKRIRWREKWLNQYELEPYLFCQAIKLGYRVTEVPVSKIYPDKKLGYSKMQPITGWWSILKPLLYLFFRIKQ